MKGIQLPMQTLGQVLEKLKREDDGSYVYRGQVREYPGPLVPAAYRPFVRKSQRFAIDGQLPTTLRRVEGVKLIERQLVGSYADHESSLDYQRRQVRTLIRGFLGYALTEVLCQQAGLCSESLDVTTSPEIAAFFACYQWDQRQNGETGYFRFLPKSPEDYGIIYRWKVEKPALSLTALKSWSYTYCPPLLDSCKILNLFEKCATLTESIRSIETYRNAFRGEFGFLVPDRQNRPMELLRLPYSIHTSRIVKQRAMLLVPDALENRLFWERYFPDFPRPEHGFWDSWPMIEDFSRSRGVELFRFIHKNDQADYLPITAADVTGDQDIELALTSGWLRAFIASPYGTIRVELSELIDLNTLDIFSGNVEQTELQLQQGEVVGIAAAMMAEAEALSQELDDVAPTNLTENHVRRVIEVTEKCSKQHTWSSAVKLLRGFRSKVSPTTHLDKYLWSSDQLCCMLQKQSHFAEARVVLDEIFGVCEDAHACRPSAESQQSLLIAYKLLFVLLSDAGLREELVTAYEQFIKRFVDNLELRTSLFMAHVRHWLATELDQAYKFQQSLEQYTEVISIARLKPKSEEEVCGLITTASFSRANCLEKLGYIQEAENEFRALAAEFSGSCFDRCRFASQLASERAAILAQL